MDGELQEPSTTFSDQPACQAVSDIDCAPPLQLSTSLRRSASSRGWRLYLITNTCGSVRARARVFDLLKRRRSVLASRRAYSSLCNATACTSHRPPASCMDKLRRTLRQSLRAHTQQQQISIAEIREAQNNPKLRHIDSAALAFVLTGSRCHM